MNGIDRDKFSILSPLSKFNNCYRVLHNLEIDEVNFYLLWPVTIYLYHWSESDYHLYDTKVISTEAKLPGFDSIRRYSWVMTIQIFFLFLFWLNKQKYFLNIWGTYLQFCFMFLCSFACLSVVIFSFVSWARQVMKMVVMDKLTKMLIIYPSPLDRVDLSLRLNMEQTKLFLFLLFFFFPSSHKEGKIKQKEKKKKFR